MPDKPKNRPAFKTQTVKGSHYAYTRVDGRRLSLGRAGSPEALSKYQRIVAEWDASETERGLAEPSRLTVAELAERFVDFQRQRVEDGEINRMNAYLASYAATALVENAEHANTPVNRFGPKALRAIQRRLAKTPVKQSAGCFRDHSDPPCLSRSEVNRRMNTIRQMFRWGVSEELVPTTVLQSLEAVSGLRVSEGRETSPRIPADPRAVGATVTALQQAGSEHIANIILLIRWTGCRPSEVCGLTASEVCETLDGLELRIQAHKTMKHTNADRVVSLNQEAAQIVREALGQGRSIDPSRHLFTNDAGKPITQSGLYQAVKRSAKVAGVAHWTPYQLRHLAAIEMLEAGASEAEAAAAIGHTPNSTVIRRYSRGRERLARKAVAGIGSRETA